MSRVELEPNTWYPAWLSKPTQGLRVLLKIADEECLVVGYWGNGWEVCDVNLSATNGAEIQPAFTPEDVRYYRAFPEFDVCETCDGFGFVGGPSFYQPDEFGERCDQCSGSGKEGA